LQPFPMNIDQKRLFMLTLIFSVKVGYVIKIDVGL